MPRTTLMSSRARKLPTECVPACLCMHVPAWVRVCLETRAQCTLVLVHPPTLTPTPTHTPTHAPTPTCSVPHHGSEVLTEFLENFEVGGQVDGKVTMSEFENYYQRISASIGDDDYFELMMRNAWHISGGEGWCANSSNRRVLATMPDGTQNVVEVKEDLGVRGDGQRPRTKLKSKLAQI